MLLSPILLITVDIPDVATIATFMVILKSVNVAQVAFLAKAVVASPALPADFTIYAIEYNDLIQLRAT